YERIALTRNVERDLLRAQPHHAPPLARDRGSRPLTGDAALAFAEHMINCRGHRRKHARGGCIGNDGVKPVRVLLGEKSGGERSRRPTRVLHQRREERNIVPEALDGERIERVGLRGDRFLARRRVGYQLGDDGVVVERNLATLVDAGVDAHGHAAGTALRRWAVAHQATDRRQEVAQWILGIDAGLHRPPRELDVALRELEPLARRNADHLLDQIDAGHEFGDRVLDLQPRVHFEKIEALVLPDDELDGAGRVVGDGLGERDRLLAHFLARRRVDQRARGLLHDLLIAALDRAFALAEMNDIAVLVSQHLNLDVARIDDIFLDEYPVVAEGGFRLRTR